MWNSEWDGGTWSALSATLNRNFSSTLSVICLHEEQTDDGESVCLLSAAQALGGLGMISAGNPRALSHFKSSETSGTAVSTQGASGRWCWGMILLWCAGSQHLGWRTPGPCGWCRNEWERWDLPQRMAVIIQGTWGVNVASVLTESTGWLEPETFKVKSHLYSFLFIHVDTIIM